MTRRRSRQQIRVISPMHDLAQNRRNRCASTGCGRPAAYVHTWRVGHDLNASHGSALLCEKHAAAKERSLLRNQNHDTTTEPLT